MTRRVDQLVTDSHLEVGQLAAQPAVVGPGEQEDEAEMDLGQIEEDKHQVASDSQVPEDMPKSCTEQVDNWLHVVRQVIHSFAPFSFSYPFSF